MISVCIATHNGAKYIVQQLKTIISQLGDEDEIVISDDGSDDDTLDIINSLNDSRIRIFTFNQSNKKKHPHERVCRNFENALKHAQGDIIFLSDQDDEWMPDKADVCKKILENYDLVLHDFQHMNDKGETIMPLHYDGAFRYRNYFLQSGKHYGCAMAFRKSVLEYALPFPKHLLLHDYWIGILSELLGNFYFEERPLIRYRIHQDNTSATNNSWLFKVLYRINIIVSVLLRVIKYRFCRDGFKLHKTYGKFK